MKKKIYILILLLAAAWGVEAQTLEPETDKKGRWGYVDNSGRVVIKFKYDEAYPFEAGVAIVRKGDKMGFINQAGKPIGKLQYSVIEPYASGEYYLVAIGGKMDTKKPKKNKTKMVGPEPLNVGGTTRIPWLGAKWGICDSKGNVFAPAVYESVTDIINGLIYVCKGGKYGILNMDGKEFVKPQYKQIGTFNSQGFCWVADSDVDKSNFVKDKFGVLGRSGKLLVPAKYDFIGAFVETTENPYGYYAAGAKVLQYTPYSQLPVSTAPYLWFSDKSLKAGIVDEQGNVIVPADKYTTVFAPTCGMIPMIQKKKMGFYNIATKEFKETNPQYVYSAFSYDLSRVNIGGLYYFADKNLKQVSGQYAVAVGFSEGCCVVGNGGKYGVIDASGREVIPIQYQNAKSGFHEGVLGVQKDGKWGFVDTAGEIAFSFEYETVGDFDKGFCSVSAGGKFGCMQRDGKLLLPMQWDDYLTPAEKNPVFIWGKKDNLFYCYDVVAQRPAFEKGYNDVTNFYQNVAVFMRDGKYGMLNTAGVEVLPAEMPDMPTVREAYLYLNKIEKDVMSPTDYMRFGLFISNEANTYKISAGTTMIPDNMWDY